MSNASIKERLEALWRRLFRIQDDEAYKRQKRAFCSGMRSHERNAEKRHLCLKAEKQVSSDDYRFFTLLSSNSRWVDGTKVSYAYYLAEHFDGRRGVFCLRRDFSDDGECMSIRELAYTHLTREKARSLLYFLERYCEEELGDGSVGQMDSGSEGDD